MKKNLYNCPFCHEKIRKEARKCRYCGEWLHSKVEVKSDRQKNITLQQWFYLWLGSIISFFLILWSVDFNFLDDNPAWAAVLGFAVLTGFSSFLGLAISIFKGLLSRENRSRTLKYLVETAIILLSFFWILVRMPSANTSFDLKSKSGIESNANLLNKKVGENPDGDKSSPSPVVKQKPTPSPSNGVTNVGSSNDPVHCAIHPNCGGGTTPLTRAECEKSTCCEVGDSKWEFMKDRSKCNNSSPPANTNNYENNFNASSTGKFSCSFHSGDYNYDFGLLTYDECKVKSDAYWNDLNSKYTSTGPTPESTMSVSEKQAIIDQHNDDVRYCRSEVNFHYSSLFQSCNQYSGSSAYDACLSAYQKNFDSNFAACGDLY